MSTDNLPVVQAPDGVSCGKWSGSLPLPEIGDEVSVAVNAIGPATVLGYFVSAGFLGITVEANDPIPWMIKQNGHARCGIFGRELGPVDAESYRKVREWKGF